MARTDVGREAHALEKHWEEEQGRHCHHDVVHTDELHSEFLLTLRLNQLLEDLNP